MNGNFVNLSHVDPSNFIAIKNGRAGHHLCSVAGGTGSDTMLSVCISLIKVMECYIANPLITNGRQMIKHIMGLQHSLENVHLQSFCCIVFGVQGLQAPIGNGVITFGTRPEKQSKSKTRITLSIY